MGTAMNWGEEDAIHSMTSLNLVGHTVRVMLDRIEAKVRAETVDKCKAIVAEHFQYSSDGRTRLLADMDQVKKPTLQELIKKHEEEMRPFIEAAERSDKITAADLNVTVRTGATSRGLIR